MDKPAREFSKKAGLPNKKVVYTGKERTGDAKIDVISYNGSKLDEKKPEKVDDCFPLKRGSITWINITGVHRTEVIEKVGRCLGLHPLTCEDITNTTQNPMMVEFDDYLSIALKMLMYNKEKREVTVEQVSLVIGPNYVVSFQEVEGDVFDPVRHRIRAEDARIRCSGSDYLAYALLDAIVDNYFVVLEELGEDIDDTEDEITERYRPETIHRVHRLKKELLHLRRSVWPLRDVINKLYRDGSKFFSKRTDLYLRDLYDHTVQVIDTVETFRDILSGMTEICLSAVSNRMNEIMKVLTVFSTIFIPLTFIVGIYGMNFRYMPELESPMAYPLLWAIMITISVVMLSYFRKKGWL